MNQKSMLDGRGPRAQRERLKLPERWEKSGREDKLALVLSPESRGLGYRQL